jgi:hypothetical protein
MAVTLAVLIIAYTSTRTSSSRLNYILLQGTLSVAIERNG